MSTVKRFEELEVWKLGMELCSDIYHITNSIQFSKDRGLVDQIRKTAVSIPSNIAEGFERDSRNQFIYFLTISKGSSGELRTKLNIAKNLCYINEKEFELLFQKCISTSKQLAGFINYLKGQKTI